MFSVRLRRARRLQDQERGAVLVEHAALFAVVVILAVIALSAFGTSILELYTDNTDRYRGAVKRNVG